jgi:hypothetical protein
MFVPIKNLLKIIFLYLFIFFYVQAAAQSQINGYDFISNLKNNANIGQIDFYVKSSDPCLIGNEKILFGINSTILNTNLNSFLNFKLQVVDCNGKIYEQSISTPLSKLQEGFNENIIIWNLDGKLYANPYQITISNYEDKSRLIQKGQIKPTDPDSLIIKYNNTSIVSYGEEVIMEIMGGDDLTNSDIRDITFGIVMSSQNNYANGGFMNGVYAKGGSLVELNKKVKSYDKLIEYRGSMYATIYGANYRDTAVGTQKGEVYWTSENKELLKKINKEVFNSVGSIMPYSEREPNIFILSVELSKININYEFGGDFQFGVYADGGKVDTKLSIDEVEKIAKETANALGSDFSVTKGSVDTGTFDLDFMGEKYDGGSYLIMDNGDVVNVALPKREVYYNYKTKKKANLDFEGGYNYENGGDFQAGVYANGGEIADIQKMKKTLIAKAKSKGIYENFGQKEVRVLEDKYGYTNNVRDFDNWAMNFDLSKMHNGGSLMEVHNGTSFMNNPIYANNGLMIDDNDGFMKADNNRNFRYPEKEVVVEVLNEDIDLNDNVSYFSKEVYVQPLNEDIGINEIGRVKARLGYVDKNRTPAKLLDMNPRAAEYVVVDEMVDGGSVVHYPSFKISKGTPYLDSFLNPGYYSYLDKERG